MAKYDNFQKKKVRNLPKSSKDLGDFKKRRKLEICPNPSKVLAISYFSSLKCDDSLRNFPKNFI
jgi:hypothetical protein